MHFLTNSEIQSTIPPHLQWDTMDKTQQKWLCRALSNTQWCLITTNLPFSDECSKFSNATFIKKELLSQFTVLRYFLEPIHCSSVFWSFSKRVSNKTVVMTKAKSEAWFIAVLQKQSGKAGLTASCSTQELGGFWDDSPRPVSSSVCLVN